MFVGTKLAHDSGDEFERARECRARYRQRAQRARGVDVYAPDGTLVGFWYPTSAGHGHVRLVGVES